MTEDNRDRFDELLEDAARTYNRPPNEREMPLDDIWDAVEVQAFAATRRPARSGSCRVRRARRTDPGPRTS